MGAVIVPIVVSWAMGMGMWEGVATRVPRIAISLRAEHTSIDMHAEKEKRKSNKAPPNVPLRPGPPCLGEMEIWASPPPSASGQVRPSDSAWARKAYIWLCIIWGQGTRSPRTSVLITFLCIMHGIAKFLESCLTPLFPASREPL